MWGLRMGHGFTLSTVEDFELVRDRIIGEKYLIAQVTRLSCEQLLHRTSKFGSLELLLSSPCLLVCCEAVMSKNTREANFRKVDVDELDEEQYRDDAEVEEDQSGQIGQREAEVRKLTSKYPLIFV